MPVHVVSGTGAREWIAGLCRLRRDWLGMVSALPSVPPPNLRALAPGCPCCTGKVVMQIALVRALRETQATRAFLQLPDPAHAQSLARVLAAPPFDRSLVAARPIMLPRDAGLGPGEVES